MYLISPVRFLCARVRVFCLGCCSITIFVIIEFHSMLLTFVSLEDDGMIVVLQVRRLVVQRPFELGLAFFVPPPST